VANLLEKIEQIQTRYSRYDSLAKSGTTNRVLGQLDNDLKSLSDIRKLGLLDHYLRRDSNALELAKISDRIDFILLEFHLIEIRDQILSTINQHNGLSLPQEYPSIQRVLHLDSVTGPEGESHQPVIAAT